ncbi:hypothetical protein [Peribacillus butanolivorans]|uniref:hypothetical protein n=1 Tax=Peribacillus butanolivorans TaxID=421767 RepID=UPI0036701278
MGGQFSINDGNINVPGYVSIRTANETVLWSGQSGPTLEIPASEGLVEKILITVFKSKELTVSFESPQNLTQTQLTGPGGGHSMQNLGIEFLRTLE